MKIKIKDEKSHSRALDDLKSIDLSKTYWYERKLYRRKRSTDSNALLWLWLSALEKDSETGYTKDNFYQMFLEMFAPRISMTINDKLTFVIKTSSNYDSKEFSKFLNDIQIWADTELSFKLPDPDDYNFKKFTDHYEQYI